MEDNGQTQREGFSEMVGRKRDKGTDSSKRNGSTTPRERLSLKSKGPFIFLILLLGAIVLAKMVLSGLYISSHYLADEALAKQEEKGSEQVFPPVITKQSLIKKEQELKKKEEEIAKKEKEYLALKEETEAKMAELNELQVKLANYAKKLAQREKALKDAKMAHLVSLYTAMEPAKAAAIMEKLRMETVVKILRNMKGKAAGRIVAMMSPEKGARISEELSKDR